jgi:hypothetical protein
MVHSRLWKVDSYSSHHWILFFTGLSPQFHILLLYDPFWLLPRICSSVFHAASSLETSWPKSRMHVLLLSSLIPQYGVYLQNTLEDNYLCLWVPVITACRVLGLRIEETATSYGGYLRIYWISSRGQPTLWFSSLGAERGANNSPPYKINLLWNVAQASDCELLL